MFRINTRRAELQRATRGDSVFLFSRLDVKNIRRSYAVQFDRTLTGAEVDEILRDSIRGWEGLTDQDGTEVRYTDRVNVLMPDAKEPGKLVEVEMSGLDVLIATMDPVDKYDLAQEIRAASWKTIEKKEQQKNGSAGSSSGGGEPERAGEKAEAPAA